MSDFDESLRKEMEDWVSELVKTEQINTERGLEIMDIFNEECRNSGILHAWDLSAQEIKFALKGE